jgi:hypothetical protein
VVRARNLTTGVYLAVSNPHQDHFHKWTNKGFPVKLDLNQDCFVAGESCVLRILVTLHNNV